MSAMMHGGPHAARTANRFRPWPELNRDVSGKLATRTEPKWPARLKKGRAGGTARGSMAVRAAFIRPARRRRLAWALLESP